MRTALTVSLAVAAACVTGPIVVRAHHSAAGIDRSASVTVEGVVKEFRWANPHSWIEMEVVNEAGETEVWNLEMFPPSFLIRAGWTRSSVRPGDRIAVTANGFINGDPGGILVSVTLPDGQVLTQRPPRRGN